MKKTPDLSAATIIVVTLGLSLGCARPPTQDEPASTRVENANLGIALAAIPHPFEMAANEGASLGLSADGPAGPGMVVFGVGQETAAGINLVAEAEGTQAWFEERTDGQYFGNLELVTPLGPAFTARGSYRDASGEIEELRVFMLHPSANRLLTVVYRYPPGQGKDRMPHLAELLGEIEALEIAAQEASSSGVDN
jgi:hypothetical protein